MWGGRSLSPREGSKNGASLLSKLALSVGSTAEAEVR